MSRTKNAVTLKTKQGNRPLAGLTLGEKYDVMRYGRKCDPAALEAVHALHNALNSGATPSSPAADKQIFEEWRDQFWEYVAERYQADWPKHDGEFFRRLADAMEVHMQVPDPARTVVGGEIIFCHERGLPMPTIAGAVKLCKGAEVTTTRKTVERIFKDFEVKPTPERRGRKRGSKQKSHHRSAGRN